MAIWILSFGGDGKVTLNLMGYLRAIDIQPDGKIVAAGISGSRFAVIRLNPDGTRDTSFGGGGIGAVDIPGSGEDVQAMAVQSDGKFVVAGSCACAGSSDFALGRISADGIADLSFGQSGAITTDFLGGDDFANGVSV